MQIGGYSDTLHPIEELITSLKNKTDVLNAVQFSVSYDAEGIAYASVTVNIDSNGILSIDQTLADILGFRDTVFKNGKHNAELQIDKTMLENLAPQTVTLRYSKDVVKSATINTPEDSSLDALAEVLHDSFAEAGETVFVTADDNEEFITFNAEQRYQSQENNQEDNIEKISSFEISIPTYYKIIKADSQ
ncbi:unnamed protein product [Orchesella dallaii]|uniref:Uncharacterized protein n=1 Tax=Orchesella dallaii TaxID=48710 RepID=A0ABP1RUG5_9HEXA